MGRRCVGCGMGPAAGNGKVETEVKHPVEILSMIRVSEAEQMGALKNKAGIVANCPVLNIEVEVAQNVEQIRVIPEIEYSSDKTAEYVTRDIFVMGQGLKTNTSYTMRGVTVAHPKTQYATQVIYTAEANRLSIDQFQMTPELYERLSVFKPKAGQTIAQKLDDIHDDLTANVTFIYHRVDIQRTIDLVYHSVLRFKFLGRTVDKGWTEALILGDTRCGKSKTMERMIEHYRCGEFISAENTSYAGLIGGIQEVQQRRAISWGKVPLNDRRLIALDEVSGMHPDAISLLSGVRSSGVAEITKIQSERTNARTRWIWLSNPRLGRPLSVYNHGVMAIRELIGRVEDIARFDIAMTAASGEVETGIEFNTQDIKVPHVYTSELCNQLVLWAWSRNPDQVKIGKDTEQSIRHAVDVLVAKYSNAIPLVEPSEQSIKIARLATALACRLFSTTDGEEVIVLPEHVEEVVRFMQDCYDKPSMGYDAFSKAAKKVDTISPKENATIVDELKKFKNWPLLRDLLLEAEVFRKDTLADQMHYDRDDAARVFGWMGKRRLIRAAMPVGYEKTSAFTAILKSLVDEKQGPEPVTPY